MSLRLSSGESSLGCVVSAGAPSLPPPVCLPVIEITRLTVYQQILSPSSPPWHPQLSSVFGRIFISEWHSLNKSGLIHTEEVLLSPSGPAQHGEGLVPTASGPRQPRSLSRCRTVILLRCCPSPILPYSCSSQASMTIYKSFCCGGVTRQAPKLPLYPLIGELQ